MKKNKILGIGIDVENISRFGKSKLSKNNRFLNKIFTKAEIDYCFSKKNVTSSLATKFAGKEAVIKACNAIDKTVVDRKKIEIINIPSGAPKVRLISNQKKEYEILISLSNDVDKAVGVAILINK